MPHDPYARTFGFLLHDVARLLRRRFDRRAGTLGLTRAQWSVLFHIHRNEGVTQSCLAQLMELQPITLARLVDRLEQDEWAERRAHPTDRRAKCLYLKEKAMPVLEQMQAISAGIRAEAMHGLSPEACDALLDALLHIKGNLLSLEGAERDQDGAACPKSMIPGE
ncbi:MarR family transcriptional regulator [Mariprofundus erugo]|uniref:MarR family winged helix-turn-helix transcriptional regulator n=1 Tax=Mariprofundus erugo TaxID=2528639 RepID=UPI0010FEA7C4|nr:MarR family transcriptional regulator [Mariprofundus erugo]TLS78350.1 MarR family transcriptional regulator [Mariprofundus erugo]